MSGTSGSWSFNPSLDRLVIEAYARIGKLGVELTQQSQMLSSAVMSANLVLGQFANLGPNLWTVQRVAKPLFIGQIEYIDDRVTVDVLPDSVILRQWPPAAYYLTDDLGNVITDDLGNPITTNPPRAWNSSIIYTDIRLYPLSRSDYVSIPQKQTQGRPTSYWLDRQIVPIFSMWPVPNIAYYELIFWRSRYVETADIISGQQLQAPARMLEAFTAALAFSLAMKFAPERATLLKAYADEAWMIASTEDVERVPFRVQPDFSGLYR